MRTIWLRVLELFHRDRREQRFTDEIQAHLDHLTAAGSLVSCVGPLRRSLRVDPLVALRED